MVVVVNMLAFYSHDTRSNLAEVYKIYYLKIARKERESTKKRPGIAYLKTC